MNCFEGVIAIADVEEFKELKTKAQFIVSQHTTNTVYYKFALKADIASQQFAKRKQQKVNKRNENDRK